MCTTYSLMLFLWSLFASVRIHTDWKFYWEFNQIRTDVSSTEAMLSWYATSGFFAFIFETQQQTIPWMISNHHWNECEVQQKAYFRKLQNSIDNIYRFQSRYESHFCGIQRFFHSIDWKFIRMSRQSVYQFTTILFD